MKKAEIQKALKIDVSDEDVKAVANALADDDDFKEKPPKKQDIEAALKHLATRLSASVKGKEKLGKEVRDKTKDQMIEDYFDIRMFGAVLSTGLNAGQVRGPMQLTFAKSIDPIFRMDCGITRKAVTRESDRKNKESTMARKPIVNYGLYRGFGHYSPYLAQKTSNSEMTSDNLFVSENDLKLFWEALWKGLDNDHSAIRHIRPRGVYVFTHCNPRGNAPSHRLFDMLKIALEDKVKNEDRSPSQFSDYKITPPEGTFKVGEVAIRILPAEELKDKEIPVNTVVFTKVYHEDYAS